MGLLPALGEEIPEWDAVEQTEDLGHQKCSELWKGTDVKTVQKMLRDSDVSTALEIYAHSVSEDRRAAQDDMLAAMRTPSNACT
jgi:hypothetical protein